MREDRFELSFTGVDNLVNVEQRVTSWNARAECFQGYQTRDMKVSAGISRSFIHNC